VVTSNVRRFGYGPITEIPLTTVYDPVEIFFTCDNAGSVQEFFTQWHQRVINHNYEPGGAVAGRADGAWPFQVSYAADYVSRVEITTYTQEGTPISITTLHDAWPRSVGQVQLAWSMTNEIKRLPVQLAYVSWTSDLMTENAGGSPVTP
jgi:hypothetical protein